MLIDSFVKRSHKWQRSLQRVYAAPAVLDLFRVTSVLSIGYVVPMFLCPQALVALPAKSGCLRIAVTDDVRNAIVLELPFHTISSTGSPFLLRLSSIRVLCAVRFTPGYIHNVGMVCFLMS